MAGFFSLGGDGGGRPPSTDQTHRRLSDEETGQAARNSNPSNPTESWFWPYGTRAVAPAQSHHQHELWLQQQQQQEGGFSTAWQDAQLQNHQGIAWGFGPSSRPSSMNNASDEGSSRSASVRGGVSCQDCGNQAKKDCAHMRCRTCCKSRGFDCPTHVKSTWVPAAKRRERQRQFAAALRHHPPQQFRGSSSGVGGGLDDPKRLRENSSMAQLAAATTTTSGLELGNFPAELSSTALFRCVRVSSTDTGDPEDHYAYRTSMTIGGHVFKGILYDRGPEATYTGGGESSSGGGSGSASAAQQQLNLMTVAATAAESSGMLPSAAAPYDPNLSIYTATPINAYMDGTQFFPHQRS